MTEPIRQRVWSRAHSTGGSNSRSTSASVSSQSSIRQGIRRGRKRQRIDAKTLFVSFASLLLGAVLYVGARHSSGENLQTSSSNLPEENRVPQIPAEEDGEEEEPNAPPEKPIKDGPRPILTAYLENPKTILQAGSKKPTKPIPPRKTSKKNLKVIEYPKVQQCSRMFETWPINEYPHEDPFLPWIHDVFPSPDGQYVNFVAQNRRRCELGKGLEARMKFWEPQMALFQPIPIVEEKDKDEKTRLRVASSVEEATVKETRFICVFHTIYDDNEYQTLSEFPFNYEYVSWRKGKAEMFQTEGKDNLQFWLSQLMFKCPVPKDLQYLIVSENHLHNDLSQMFVDLVPIRTPPRHGEQLFTTDHVSSTFLKEVKLYDLNAEFGKEHYLPDPTDSGRWANIPICSPPEKNPKRNKMVACTWTAASYTRRGDVVKLGDTEARLREWILFHHMVGFDQLYVYDNSSPDMVDSPLKAITEEFSNVHYHRWPCLICNNNRPSHKNPGERSSQYAAEASCRERYGPNSDWMAFIDTDEYLVPMMQGGDDIISWRPVLDAFEEKNVHILKMRSSRAKPRVDLMEANPDQSTCKNPVNVREPPGDPQPCLIPSKTETFLRVYNCEYIQPPRPERFERAMKQIYRPSHVWSHFVHYSTVTEGVARYHKDFGPEDGTYSRSVHAKSWQANAPEIFLDEVKEGMLIHTRSVLPHETKYRDQACALKSKYTCSVGFVCPNSTEFDDSKHKDNVFVDEDGKYCNCWRTAKVEEVYVPKLETLIQEHVQRLKQGNNNP